jgi:hypothetical protein
MQFITNLPAAEAHKLVPLRDHPRPAVVEPSAPPRPSVVVPVRAAERRARQTGHAHA